MVAEHDHAVGAQRVHQSQGFQRFAAAIDQVAAEPERVDRRIEADAFEQALRRRVAALQVADRPDAHARLATSAPQCSVRGTDSVNGGIGASKRVPSSASMS